MDGYTCRERQAALAILRCIAANTAQSTTFTLIDNTVFLGYGDIALLSMLIDKMTADGLLVEARFSHYSITAHGRDVMNAQTEAV